MIVRLARSSIVTLLVVGLVVVGGPSSAPESSSGPEISNFTIDPPFASSNGAARIRFEFRGAEGGLQAATLVAKPDRGTWRTSVLEEPVIRASVFRTLEAGSDSGALRGGDYRKAGRAQ